VNKDLLPAAGKETMGIFSKAVSSLNKEAWSFQLWSLCIFIQENSKSGMYSEHTQFEVGLGRKDGKHILENISLEVMEHYSKD
jgi:hypothetical protein